MKYIKLNFDYGKFSFHETSTMNGYIKNRIYLGLSAHHMYIDIDKLEEGKKRYKKELLKYYNNKIKIIEAI